MTKLESQRDEFHTEKVRTTKEKSIVISSFKSDIPPIMGVLGEGKEIFAPLTEIRIPYLWNTRDGVRGVYPRAPKSLHDQRIKLQARINQ